MVIRSKQNDPRTVASSILSPYEQPKPRNPVKTKAELRAMLAEAVRNTQPQPETKPLPKAKKGRGTD